MADAKLIGTRWIITNTQGRRSNTYRVRFVDGDAIAVDGQVFRSGLVHWRNVWQRQNGSPTIVASCAIRSAIAKFELQPAAPTPAPSTPIAPAALATPSPAALVGTEAPGEVATEVGWLFEHDGTIADIPCGGTAWACIKPPAITFGKPEVDWTHDASKALRFVRREDAEAFRAGYLGLYPRDWDVKAYRVTEHMWPVATHPEAAPVAPSEPMYLVMAGGDGFMSSIVPASKLDEAYLLTQWCTIDPGDSEEHAEALAHFHADDEWTHTDVTGGGECLEFSLSLEDGWIKVIRLFDATLLYAGSPPMGREPAAWISAKELDVLKSGRCAFVTPGGGDGDTPLHIGAPSGPLGS